MTKVADAIRDNGKPNPSFPNDRDISYEQLQKLCNTIGGLPAVLKQMKARKQVDYGDKGFFKPESVITLIADYEAQAQSTQITYDQINDKIKGNISSHQKTGGW